MASSQATVDSVLDRLRSKRFSAKKMFGEYAVYADGKVVALVCDDRLYVKVHAVTEPLSREFGLAPPYPGAKPHYVLDEGDWAARDDLPNILATLAGQLPLPKKRR